MFKLGVILFFLALEVSARTQFSFDAIAGLESSEVIHSDINPDNLIFKLPTEAQSLDLRAEFKWSTQRFLTVVRPRFVTLNEKIYDLGTDQSVQKNQNDFNLTDAFFEIDLNTLFKATVGLQVYQWGPTEFTNASNSFFHLNPKQKSLYFKEKGKALIRLNFSPNQYNNIVLIAEPISNNESTWQEDEEFKPQAAIKYEKSWPSSFNSIGIIAGTNTEKNYFIGEYGSFYPIDNFSFYTDIKHNPENISYQPVYNGSSYDMLKLNQDQQTWTHLAVTGLRYEGAADFRIEYIYNSAGYNSTKMKQALQSASNMLSPLYILNLKRYLKPGLEILGEQYLYTSLRINDPLKIKDFNLSGRYLHSIQDSSSQLQIEFEKSFFSSLSTFVNQTLSLGERNTEFRLTNDWQIIAGIKWSY